MFHHLGMLSSAVPFVAMIGESYVLSETVSQDSCEVERISGRTELGHQKSSACLQQALGQQECHMPPQCAGVYQHQPQK
jgi:hypothetical protein